MKKTIIFILLLISFAGKTKTAKDYYDKGNEKSNNKDFEGSIGEYDLAIKMDPQNTDAYYNRGTSKLYLKDYKGALSDFDKTLALSPRFVKAYTNRGITKLKMNNIKGAIADFDSVIKNEPDNASSYYMRGQMELQTGDTKGGCNDLTKANDLGDTRSQKLLKQYCEGEGGEAEKKEATKPSESLKLNWPEAEGWRTANKERDNEREVVELLKNKETFENWTEIGTMMTYPALHNIPVDAAMNAMYEQAKKTCPEATLTFIEKDEKVKYPSIIFKIECGAAEPESQVWQMIQGTNELYANFRAVKQKTVPDVLRDKWVAFFKTARIVTE